MTLPVLGPLLLVVAVYAALFFLVWLLARQRLSARAQVVGWLSVLITAGGCLWSFLAETVLPYLRRGPAGLLQAGLSVLQLAAALVGIAAMLLGAARFLRSWLSIGWALGSMQDFLKASPPFAAIRRESKARARWRLVLALASRVLLAPGLGLMMLGLGVLILAFQVLEPDPSLRPDPASLSIGWGAVGLGLLQMALRWWRQAKATPFGR